jgi:ABC-type transport system involved in multi-copper enzyme maturation permease subunit
LQLTSVLGLIAVAAVALSLGALRFVRKDIAV